MTEKPVEFDFPVSEYYKNFIRDGRTLAKTGIWWSAILLLADPKSGKPFISLYRWQKTKGGWKVRKRYSLHRPAEVKEVVGILEEFAGHLHAAKESEA